VLLNAVRGISDLVMVPGLINVDFADVRTIMTGMGRALMGTGQGKGEKRALEAAQQAISSPLLEDVSINGATGILINITGGPDLTLSEVTEAATLIEEAADPGANIIFGSVIDAHAGDSVRITVIATGFQPSADQLMVPTSAPAKGGTPTRRPTDQMALPMGGAAPSRATPAFHAGGPAPHAMSAPPTQPTVMPGFPVVQPPGAQAYATAQPQSYAPMGTGRPVWPNAVPSAMGPGGTAPWPPAVDQPSYYEEARIPTGEMAGDSMELIEDADGEFSDGLGGRGAVGATANDWGSGPTGERPIIRPAVPGNPALRGRNTGAMRAGGDQFGDEDSELDRPTFIRRGILPPG